MNTPREPEIIINGVKITDAMAMTVRVAVSSFYMTLATCKDDDISKLYLLRLQEIVNIFNNGVSE